MCVSSLNGILMGEQRGDAAEITPTRNDDNNDGGDGEGGGIAV